MPGRGGSTGEGAHRLGFLFCAGDLDRDLDGAAQQQPKPRARTPLARSRTERTPDAVHSAPEAVLAPLARPPEGRRTRLKEKGAVWGGEGAARRVNEGEGRPDVEAIRVYEDSELKKPAPKALQQVTAKATQRSGARRL